jgi:hypothetical protein
LFATLFLQVANAKPFRFLMRSQSQAKQQCPADTPSQGRERAGGDLPGRTHSKESAKAHRAAPARGEVGEVGESCGID